MITTFQILLPKSISFENTTCKLHTKQLKQTNNTLKINNNTSLTID